MVLASSCCCCRKNKIKIVWRGDLLQRYEWHHKNQSNAITKNELFLDVIGSNNILLFFFHRRQKRNQWLLKENMQNGTNSNESLTQYSPLQFIYISKGINQNLGIFIENMSHICSFWWFDDFISNFDFCNWKRNWLKIKWKHVCNIEI